MEERRSLGRRLRELRERAGLTQEDLAREIGVAGPTVSHYERGHTGMSAQDLPTIARALGVQPAAFFEGDRHTTYEFAAVAPGRVSEMAEQYLTGWAGLRDHDRRLLVDVLEALGRWRDRALARQKA